MTQLNWDNVSDTDFRTGIVTFQTFKASFSSIGYKKQMIVMNPDTIGIWLC